MKAVTEMKNHKSVELYDTFAIDHPVTGEMIRVQAMEGNSVISCRECLFRKKEFKKICQSMRCVDAATGECQTYKQIKL